MSIDYSGTNKKPKLIIACGLTGTGKSTIMKEVAEKKGITLLASDVMRKKLAGIHPEEHRYVEFDSGIYSKEFSEKTYLQMIEEGKKLLMIGESVILDACFPKRWQRMKALDAVKEAKAELLCIEFVCPEEEIKERLARRFESKEGASDGRWEIYISQKASFEEVNELPSESHLIIYTSKPKEESIKRIIEELER